MPVTVKLEPADSPISEKLIRELSAELGALYGDDGNAAFDPSHVMVPRSAFVVAWANDDPVGCGALRPMADPSIGEIKRMFVQKHMRGRGISRQILYVLEALAKDFGYERLLLETGIYQTQAMHLYENSGFVRCDCYGEYADDPRSVCYEKTLTSL